MRRPPTVIRSIAGATIGFDISDEHLAAVEAAFSFVAPTPEVVAPSDATPAIVYRHEWFRDAMRFLRDDPLRTEEPTPVGTTLDLLVDDLQLSIALHARDTVFVHAGAVVWNGRAIVLPGRSRAGKSTLVDALVRAGATYLSDEYARLTPDGQVAPFARPLHLRTVDGRRLVEPTSIGVVAAEPAEPGLVVLTRYEADARFAPEVVAPARAALAVFDNTVVAEVAPEAATEAAARLVGRAVCVRSPRGDVADTVRAILDLAETIEVPV
ncbi:MAG: hypothetical protein AAF081_06505 [Actinomycetota bacterium]